MALNLELLLALLVEQEEAITTADRCRRQISRLLAEQLQRSSLEQITTEASGEHSAGPPKKRKHQSTQPEDTSDEDLLEALRLHEMRGSEQPAHSPARQQPYENTQRGQRNAMLGSPLPDTWSQPPQATHSISTEQEPPAASNERP